MYSGGIIILQKSLYSLFYAILGFCSKGMKATQRIKTTFVFIPFNNADSSFTARSCHPSLFGIIKRITCFP